MSSWNDSLLIGVESIDNQHRDLVNRMDQLFAACCRGVGEDEAGDTIKFIVSYVNAHFKDEEELQSSYKYPDATAHKKLHADFVKRIIDLMQHLKAGDSTDFADKVNKILIDWFITHIITEDKKIGAHIHKIDDTK